MLGKLLKHEFRTTGRYISILLGILILVTPLSALYLKFSTSDLVDRFTFHHFNIFRIFSVTSGIIYMAALVAAVTATSILLIYNLYKSMIASQGYLTHTLPVPVSSIIISKGVVMFVWQIIAFIVAYFSFMVFTYILGAWNFKDLHRFISQLLQLDSPGLTTFIILVIANIFFGFIQKILMFFASFAVGHRLNGHPFAGSVIAYAAGSAILSVVSIITTTFIREVLLYKNSLGFMDSIDITLISSLIISIVSGVAFYIISVYMFKNKLDI